MDKKITKVTSRSTRIRIVTINGKKKYEIDGVKYNSFEELPTQYKNMLADKNRNGIPDVFEFETEEKEPIPANSSGKKIDMNNDLNNKFSKKQYCDQCGAELNGKSFFGFIKCYSCGKRTRKR